MSKLGLIAAAAFVGTIAVFETTSTATQNLVVGKNPPALGKAFISAFHALSAPSDMSGFGYFVYERFKGEPELFKNNLIYRYGIGDLQRSDEIELALIKDQPKIKLEGETYSKADKGIKEAMILYYAAAKYGHITTSEQLLDAALKKAREDSKSGNRDRIHHKLDLEAIKARQLAFPNIPLDYK